MNRAGLFALMLIATPAGLDAAKSLSGREAGAAKPLAPSKEEAPFVAYPGYRPDPCYFDPQHDAADLCAQWRAAVAAERSAEQARQATRWAAIGTVLAFFTTLGLIVTILQAQATARRARKDNSDALAEQAKALAIAERNANAAAEQVTLSKENQRRELRAYVDIESVKLTEYPRLRTAEKRVIGPAICLRNFGRTPADDFRTEITYETRSASEIRQLGTHIKSGLGGLMPNDVLRWVDKIEFSSDRAEQIERDDIKIYFEIAVRYKDAFGCEHEIRSSYESHGVDSEFGFIPGSRSAT